MEYIVLLILWAMLLLYALGATLVTWGMFVIIAGICFVAAGVAAWVEDRSWYN